MKQFIFLLSAIFISLNNYAQTQLWGMTYQGGKYGRGTIFRTDGSGSNHVVEYDFFRVEGGSPTNLKLTEYSDGKLYGTTTEGLFQYDPVTNNFVKKIDFTGVTYGNNPTGSLLYASNGKLYGMTNYGGTNNYGAIFQYDPITNICTKKYDFTLANGSSPNGSLMQASSGKMYGMTSSGGSNGYGVLFEYDPVANTYAKKIDFAGASNGKIPAGDLIQATDGNLYGMTSEGGVNGYGIVFQYNPGTNVCTNKYNFNIGNGMYPKGSLMQASDGNLYGMTESGGSNGLGVLFQYDFNTNILVNKIHFASLASGSHPNGNLMQATDGNLYGLTLDGGANSFGVLFQYNPVTSIITKKFDFNGYVTGKSPYGSLMQASNGKFYGVTYTGGVSVTATNIDNGAGVLFQFDPSTNVYTKKLDFDGALDGYLPAGSLVQTPDGMLYGMTSDGGKNGYGVIFQYNPTTHIYTDKFDFNLPNGNSPGGSLMLASDGKLYGVAFGGATNEGVLFQYDYIANVYTKKIDFDQFTTGNAPKGDLVEATDGKFYGLTMSGGVNFYGSLFQYDPVTNICVGKFDFDYPTSGAYPTESLMQASNGKLYGLTSTGGSNGQGVLFEYDPAASTFTKKIDFALGINGHSPNGSLMQASDGKLYGLTSLGGSTVTTQGDGVLFQYDYSTNTYVKKKSFSGTINFIGAQPNGSLIQATDGKLYCISSAGGVNNFGDLIQYDITTNSVAQQVVFNGVNGATAYHNNLIEINFAVWPGDANSDGVANNLDVLELGLHYNQTGAPRTSISNNWQAYIATNWAGTITNGRNLNHSDCNGDGTIDANDTLAIYNNYGLTHTFKPAQTNTVTPQLSIVPDQLLVTKGNWGTASIYLGDAATNINNINGIAFTVDFDNTLIEPNSIYVEYQNSFIDAGQNLHFRKLDFVNNKLFIASTHTISNNASGFGKIATLHYQISSTLATDQTLILGVSQVNQSNASGVISPLTSGTGTLMAIGASVGVKENNFSGNVLISPNPTNGLLNISFGSIPQNTKIELYNSIGALVLTEVVSNKNNTINVSDLSSGIYFMKVLEGSKVVVVKKVVKE